MTEKTDSMVVEIDCMVVLQIINACKQESISTGQLLGLANEGVIEVTNSFPYTSGDTAYQADFMRCLREVNADNNTVGWYQSAFLGSYVTEDLVTTQYNYQLTIRNCVLLIYDPLKSAHGALALTAVRLTDRFMKLYQAGTFTKQELVDSKFSFDQVFQKLPVRTRHSVLGGALLRELGQQAALQPRHDSLDLASNQVLEKNLEFLSECVDDLASEQSKFQYYKRQVARRAQQQQLWLNRRQAENQARRQDGRPELSESADDPDAPINKMKVSVPARLESILITNQMHAYCAQVFGHASGTLTKLNLLEKLSVNDETGTSTDKTINIK